MRRRADGTAPVSYTHLDVYKRQLSACVWPFPWCFEKTDDTQKAFAEFPFDADGLAPVSYTHLALRVPFELIAQILYLHVVFFDVRGIAGQIDGKVRRVHLCLLYTSRCV